MPIRSKKRKKPEVKKQEPEKVEYRDPKECLMIQWEKLHMRDGKPACPSCGQPAEQILIFFGLPGWAHL